MTRSGIAKSNIFLLSSYREVKRVDQRRHLSKVRGSEDWAREKSRRNKESDDEVKRGSSSSSWRSSWVPDPRTGIYFPKGHERVMDAVPKGAASLNNQTFWFRNVDGVLEKPDPDTPPDHYYHQINI